MSNKPSQNKENGTPNHISKWADKLHGTISPLHLKGIRIDCPACGEKGTISSRWVEGLAVKPVYVIHNRNGTVKNICGLEEEEAAIVRSEAKVYKSDLGKILSIKKCFVLISGGKDSLATLVYTQKIAEEVGADLRAIHVDTTVGFPEVTKYVRKVCRQLRVKLSIVRPQKNFFDLAKDWGIPSFRFRWCCRELKIKPVQDFLDRISGNKVVIDGIRAEESNLRAKYLPVWYHPGFRCLSVSPIFRWSKEQVIKYVENANLPENPVRKLGCSAECWCGAYKTKTDFLKLKEIKPELFRKLSDLEKRSPTGYTFLYKNGQRIPLKELV
jgi:3'-phosphoadenosine 5'-phosphosulfate sulfotransferase (PAPS reductase)/FAD synthetase